MTKREWGGQIIFKSARRHFGTPLCALVDYEASYNFIPEKKVALKRFINKTARKTEYPSVSFKSKPKWYIFSSSLNSLFRIQHQPETILIIYTLETFLWLWETFIALSWGQGWGLSEKATCLRGIEDSKPQSHTTEINFGYMSTIQTYANTS